MDLMVPVQLLLLTFGVAIAVIAQQNMNQCPGEKRPLINEKSCGSGWICPQNEACDNKAKCRCEKGYFRCKSKRGRACRDVNECQRNHGCGDGATCKNTNGSYYCECNAAQFCPKGRPKNYCYEYKVMQICNFAKLDKLGQCDRLTIPDAICSVLQNTSHLLNSSCQANHSIITKEKAIERFTEVAKSLTVVLVDANILSIANSSQRGTFFTQILDTVEATTLLSFTTAPRNQNISTTNIDISMMASRDHCLPGVQFTTLITSDNIMQIPCSLVPGEKDGSIFITYKGLDSGLNGNILITQQVSVNNRMAVVNSRVVTGAITTPVRKKLSSPVIYRLSHLKDLEPFHMFICVFWDSNNKVWSDKGCTTEYYNNTHSTCTCSHFSSFAVIMAPHEIEDHLGLIILSHVGLSISLLCLCLSLLTFILCRSLRSVHTSVLSILCGCLFLGQLLFLVGLDQTFNKFLCAVIAGGLQFLFLCAFCWMCIESILLFMTVRNLRALNYMTSQRSNFPVMCLLGFGVPAVIVGISAAVRPLDYGSQRYCWLHSSLRWSFLGPVCVFIIVNTILLALTIFLLRIRLASLNLNVSSLKNTRLLTFKALAQVFILGCTWSIGFFQFGSGSLVISYLFTICNSLQGAYIFLVHCLLNHQVREEYRRLFRRFHTRSKPVSDVFTNGTLQTASRSTNMSNITKPAVNIQKSSPEMKAHWV